MKGVFLLAKQRVLFFSLICQKRFRAPERRREIQWGQVGFYPACTWVLCGRMKWMNERTLCRNVGVWSDKDISAPEIGVAWDTCVPICTIHRDEFQPSAYRMIASSVLQSRTSFWFGEKKDVIKGKPSQKAPLGQGFTRVWVCVWVWSAVVGECSAEVLYIYTHQCAHPKTLPFL